jgi:DNA-directed RNA polymerase subunit RPC12/RpoP
MRLFVVRVNEKVYYILILEINDGGSRKMQRDLGLWKLNEADCTSETSQTGFTCDECGGAFKRPILATISMTDHKKTYYACPRCMTKVHDTTRSENREAEKTAFSNREDRRPAARLETNVKCEHFFGYLNKRQRDMQIPDECLTCSKMVECLLH